MIFRKKEEPAPAKKPEPVIKHDKDTGLPVLPDDLKWVVRKKQLIRYSYGMDYYADGYEAVIIDKRKRVIANSTFEELTDRNVSAAARNAYRKYEEQRKQEDAEARLLGEYPPNAIGESND